MKGLTKFYIISNKKNGKINLQLSNRNNGKLFSKAFSQFNIFKKLHKPLHGI